MCHKQNATDSASENSDKDSTEMNVSLGWIRRQFGRVLEVFVILQFVAGASIFFCGIFFLLWSVAPAASLEAGSYMLLAFFVIGRALLGLVGYYTNNFCLLFSYGVLLLVTFVIRTIMILVRLKINTGPEDLIIPPLLKAVPGAFSAPIELICSLLECSQAFCSFYLCWIVTKTNSFEKEVGESNINLNIANEVAKYLSERKLSCKIEDKMALESEEKDYCDNKNIEETSRKMSMQSQQPENADQSKHKTPLKGILHHQPNYYSQSNLDTDIIPTQSHQMYQHHQCPVKGVPENKKDLEDIDYFNVYRKYPRPHHPKPKKVEKLEMIDKERFDMKDRQQDEDDDVEVIENIDAIVEDYHNNNHHVHHYQQQQQQPQAPPNMPNQSEYYPQHQITDRQPQWNYCANYIQQQQQLHQHEPTNYEPIYSNEPRMTPKYHKPMMIDSPTVLMPETMTNSMEIARALSPIPPSEMNSPLLYDQTNMYHRYGSTDDAHTYINYPPMYR